ncbi:MAG: DUF58 domain-containing protein [Burkholderiales bacterium]|jgi:uncharacterized protein (DUF58 family)|nr:DUF58 domain-containing protein [Burkholderiales bacterium]
MPSAGSLLAPFQSLALFWRRRLGLQDAAGIVLTQGRIFVLPTRRGIMLLGAVTLMLLMSLNDSISLGFIVTFLWFGVIAVTLIQTFKNLWGVSVTPIAAGHTFVGGQLPFSIQIGSGKEAREGLSLFLDNEPIPPFDLTRGETRMIHLSRKTTERGYCVMGRIKIESEAPLGLWRAWAYAHFPLKGIVFPSPEVSPPPLPHATLPKTGGTIGMVGNEDLAGLREYQKGDPIQRIAWKAVARGNGWFTKVFEGGRGQKAVVLNYNALPSSMSLEARLSRLTAWVIECARAGVPFSLVIPPDSLPLSIGDKHEHDALTLLALFGKK